jgi:flagellar biosynthesis protein FlhA
MKGQGDPMTILRTYALLSVGEGLVSQLPALLISTASGLMVTRAGQDRSMGAEVASQFLNQPKAIGYSGGALLAMAFVPGFPTLIFLGAGAACLALARYLNSSPDLRRSLGLESAQERRAHIRAAEAVAAAVPPTGPEAVLPLLSLDPLEIEIGYGLTKLADPKVGGDLTDRVTATRKQIAVELGFVMPTVRIRDSIHLRTHEYILKVRGEEVARAELMPGLLLAVNSGVVMGNVGGIVTKDPVFGLEAVWIEPGMREQAERNGKILKTRFAQTDAQFPDFDSG